MRRNVVVVVAAIAAGVIAASASAPATPTRAPLFVEFSAATGAPLPALPQVARGGTVYALADDGRGGWYVGGSFSSIGGIGCANLAHIGADRRVDRGWCPHPNNTVRALLRVDSRLFVGGEAFSRAAGKSRANLAAFDTVSGRLLPWNPAVESRNERNGYAGVYQLALSPDGQWLYVNGIFNRLGGAFRRNFAAVGVRNGRASSFAPNPVANVHDDCVTSFAATRKRVYAAGAYTWIGGLRASGPVGAEWVALDARTGRAVGRAPKSNGGPSAMMVVGDTVYVGGGFTRVGGAARTNLAAFDGATGTATDWSPAIDAKLYPEALALSGRRIVAALTADEWNTGPRRLAAFDLNSAKLAWQIHLPASGAVTIASNGKAIVVGA